MIPSPNSHITIVFKVGAQVSGTVIEWLETKAILRSTTGNQTIVIQDTAEILFYKYSDPNIKTEFEAIAEKPVKLKADIETLADLKTQLNEIEKEQIQEKLRSHEPSGNPQVNYGSSLSMLFGGIKK